MWLINNAGTIASLCSIGTTIVAVVFYLRKKLLTPSEQIQTKLDIHNLIVPPQPIMFLQWIEIFAQGFIDVVDFIIHRFSVQSEGDTISDARSMVISVGGCVVVPFGGGGLALVLAIIFTIFGVQDFGAAFRAGAQITLILLFLIFALLYVYVVGRKIEKIQSAYYQSHLNQQVATQETSNRTMHSTIHESGEAPLA